MRGWSCAGKECHPGSLVLLGGGPWVQPGLQAGCSPPALSPQAPLTRPQFPQQTEVNNFLPPVPHDPPKMLG